MTRLLSLPDFSFSRLTGYFSSGFDKPVSYYNPLSAVYFSGKLKGMFPGQDLYLRECAATPVFITGSRCFIYCPKTEEAALEIIEKIREESPEPVWIVAPGFIPADPVFKVQLVRKQIIYDCRQIAEDYTSALNTGKSRFLHKRSVSVLRKNARDCRVRDMEAGDSMDIDKVITEWSLGKKDADSLNLQKDREVLPVALHRAGCAVVADIVYRGRLPVSISLIAGTPAHPDFGSQIVSKSLNYKTQEGGYNETSVWHLYQTCARCLEQGIHYINASGYDSADSTLGEFKLRFSRPDLNFEVTDFITAF